MFWRARNFQCFQISDLFQFFLYMRQLLQAAETRSDIITRMMETTGARTQWASESSSCCRVRDKINFIKNVGYGIKNAMRHRQSNTPKVVRRISRVSLINYKRILMCLRKNEIRTIVGSHKTKSNFQILLEIIFAHKTNNQKNIEKLTNPF